jgi:hypothetical protein
MRVSTSLSITVIVVVASSHRCVIETLLCGSRYSKPSEDSKQSGVDVDAPSRSLPDHHTCISTQMQASPDRFDILAATVKTIEHLAHAVRVAVITDKHTLHKRTKVPSMNDPCPNFEGNSDFYGLGIRIGIYLQWFSSWISNSVNPSAAATNHDTNTVFLCAILIATAVASADGSLQLVEKYILLLLSSGFFCTVLSFFELRLRLLQPSSLKPFRKALCEKLASRSAQYKSFIDGVQINKKLDWLQIYELSQLTSILRHIGLQPDSKFRHPALSWAGVIVRTSVGFFLAILSLMTWWWASPVATADRTVPCVTAFYFFGLRDLSGGTFMFFRVASIMLALPIGCMFLLAVTFISDLARHTKDWLVRYGVIRISERLSRGTWDRLGDRENILIRAFMREVRDPFLAYNPRQIIKTLMRKRVDGQNIGLDPDPNVTAQLRLSRPGDQRESDPTAYIREFWNVDASNCPPFSDLLQAFMSLFSRSVETK